MTKLLLKSRIMDGLRYFKSDQLNIYEAADGIMRMIEEYESNQVQAGVMEKIAEMEKQISKKINTHEEILGRPKSNDPKHRKGFIEGLRGALSIIVDVDSNFSA